MFCDLIWEDKEKQIVRCVRCGRSRASRKNDLSLIRYVCKTEDKTEARAILKKPEPPPTITRLKNFTKAAISHVTAGNPTCTQEQIDARYKICADCPLFIRHGNEAGICSHPKCGCNITREQIFLNKLGWADQSCPIGKWGPIENKETEKEE